MSRRHDVRGKALYLLAFIVSFFASLPVGGEEAPADGDRELSISAERIYQQKLALLKAKASISTHDIESMAMWSARIMFWESAKLRRELLLQEQSGWIGGRVSDELVEAVEDGLSALEKHHERMKTLEALLSTSARTDETVLARAMAVFFRNESQRLLAEQRQLRAGEAASDLLPVLELPPSSPPDNLIEIDMKREGRLMVDGREMSLEQVEEYVADQVRKDPHVGVVVNASREAKNTSVNNVVAAISKYRLRVMIRVLDEPDD